MARRPPPKRKDEQRGPRRLNGDLVDIPTEARTLGITTKMLEARVARREIPFRRWGSRIVFLHSEVLEYFRRLPGCTLDEAIDNINAKAREAGR